MQVTKNIKIATKLMVLICAGLVVVSTVLTSISAYRMYLLTSHNQASYQVSLMDSYDQMIKGQVQSACSILQTLDDKARRGEMSLVEAKKQGTELLRSMRYGSEGYFWADTVEGINILHGSVPELEGKNRIEYKDHKNNFYIKDIIRNGRQKGGGISVYWFHKLGSDIPLEKRAYSLEFKPWGWVVGTGNYIDDIQKILDEQRRMDIREFELSLRYLLVTSLCTILLFMSLGWLLTRKLVIPLRNCVALANRIASGDLDTQIEITRNDEVGQLSEAMNSMMVNLRLIIDLRRKAQTDALTSANNRGHFMELLEGALRMSRVVGTPLTMMLFDLDHFKRINDNYGHVVGDEALRTVARVVASFGLRHTDFWGRLGGEEFAIVLHDTRLAAGIQVAERLRKALSEASVSYEGGTLNITASIGVAESRSTDDSSTLVNRADIAMYRAKAAGRNLTCFASDGEVEDGCLQKDH